MTDDPRRETRPQSVQRSARHQDFLGIEPTPESSAEPPASASTPPRHLTAAGRAAYVETAIEQAIQRGEFDDLPGAGKPIPDLGDHHDPDWWIRRKIQTEQLSGLGPEALTLRVEAEGLPDRLDELQQEADVRELVEDFNKRVIRARMQLQGGPPVVTPTRDVDAEVVAWRDRRTARDAAEERTREQSPADQQRTRLRWWRRSTP